MKIFTAILFFICSLGAQEKKLHVQVPEGVIFRSESIISEGNYSKHGLKKSGASPPIATSPTWICLVFLRTIMIFVPIICRSPVPVPTFLFSSAMLSPLRMHGHI